MLAVARAFMERPEAKTVIMPKEIEFKHRTRPSNRMFRYSSTDRAFDL
jgi:hypothetical protein